MGAHSSAHDLMAGVESDAVAIHAQWLAMKMTQWLEDQPYDIFEPAQSLGGPYARSDLVEWCRSARDVLEAVGRG